jgi:GT2 family glycosyltransferase
MYGEEADLCARARALGARPMMTPDARIIHYGGASAASHATKIAYVMGARMGLIDRHLFGLERQIGRAATLAHVVLRAGAFRVLARLRPSRFGPAAREWGRAWAQRAQWRYGPSPVELMRQT